MTVWWTTTGKSPENCMNFAVLHSPPHCPPESARVHRSPVSLVDIHWTHPLKNKKMTGLACPVISAPNLVIKTRASDGTTYQNDKDGDSDDMGD